MAAYPMLSTAYITLSVLFIWVFASRLVATIFFSLPPFEAVFFGVFSGAMLFVKQWELWRGAVRVRLWQEPIVVSRAVDPKRFWIYWWVILIFWIGFVETAYVSQCILRTQGIGPQ